MTNTKYNDITDAIKAKIIADAEFADASGNVYLNTMTLENAVFPCMFIAKIERETKESELDEALTEDTLTYQVEVYYLDYTGHEVNLNKKDYALKALIRADPSLNGKAADAQCYSSRITSTLLQNKIVTGLEARIVVFVDN
ncbi:hypothetical protein ANME2D_02320 [Candidatus Methanoperedens nitroreducens]|uniref:Uncharacterized protein n=1 Tax=Candidatus Methanoperedens nitratireducens TaxID=1392998 RepID=A0A062V873_9EURY|nr:hypothetical protein [Candidatus Methanoperedens nitroreducens]KCZ71585.1 hypothetical protein ANME2D_02320 [Candidatus Methanoperedens nitroreducens]MDJ1421214.1 hypothetical protein [Candidatus Methanoperedens sp.]